MLARCVVGCERREESGERKEETIERGEGGGRREDGAM
jgi:hypothetical protein